MYPDVVYCAALAALDAIGPARLERMYRICSSWEGAWNASASDIRRVGIDDRHSTAFLEARERFVFSVIAHVCERDGIWVVLKGDPSYPALLRTIYDPPFALFVRGALPMADQMCIGISGTRRATKYGFDATQLIVPELARAGACIVGGLCLGIDTYAHDATLVSRGTTVAVLACGIDENTIYPAVNRPLAQRIIEAGGCIISEQAPLVRPRRYTFPLRNRIIAGISQAVLVIEAPEKSGALITASYALQENRDVFAVPGQITCTASVGTNDLVRKGAHVALSGADILNFYSFAGHETRV